MALKLACIFMASGHSTRFCENKLLSDFGGKMLVDSVFENFPLEFFNQTVVVTRYAPVAVSAAQFGFTIVENDDQTDDISKTIRLGMEALRQGMDGCMFSVCDQPLLTAETIGKLVQAFIETPKNIVALSYHGKRGNPVFFPKELFEELKTLPFNQPGGTVIAAHPELLKLVSIENRHELIDIDYRSDLDALTHLAHD